MSMLQTSRTLSNSFLACQSAVKIALPGYLQPAWPGLCGGDWVGYARGRGIEGRRGRAGDEAAAGRQRSRSKKTSFLEQDFCPSWARFSAQKGKKIAAQNKPKKHEKILVGVFLLISFSILGRQKSKIWSKKLCVIEQENLAL